MIEASVALPRLPQPAPMYSPQDQTETRRLTMTALDALSAEIRDLKARLVILEP